MFLSNHLRQSSLQDLTQGKSVHIMCRYEKMMGQWNRYSLRGRCICLHVIDGRNSRSTMDWRFRHREYASSPSLIEVNLRQPFPSSANLEAVPPKNCCCGWAPQQQPCSSYKVTLARNCVEQVDRRRKPRTREWGKKGEVMCGWLFDIVGIRPVRYQTG